MYSKCLSLEPYNVVFYVLQATTLDSIGECACLCPSDSSSVSHCYDFLLKFQQVT
jgi:hypothetical protein